MLGKFMGPSEACNVDLTGRASLNRRSLHVKLFMISETESEQKLVGSQYLRRLTNVQLRKGA